MDLFDSHLFEHLFLDSPVETVLLEGKSFDLFFGFPNVVLGEDISDFLFIEVVGDEEFCDILALGHVEPDLASGVPVDEVVEVVEFVFDDPVVGDVRLP